MSIAGRELRVLHIEVSEDDAFLARRALERGGLRVAFKRVESLVEFESQLAAGQWDLVLCDYEAKGFTASDALRRIAEYQKTSTSSDIPFIVLAGCIGEENTAEIIRHGAHDYINKNKLSQLVPAVERELIEARIRQNRPGLAAKESEAHRVHVALFEASPDPVMVLDHEGVIIELNPAAFNLFELDRSSCLGRNVVELSAWRSKADVESVLKRHQSGVCVRNEEISLLDRDQQEHLIAWSIEELELSSVARILWFGREITQMRESEQSLNSQRTYEALGRFGAGAAKDLQTTFSDILRLIESAAHRSAEDAVLGRCHHGIRSAAVAGSCLVQRIGKLSRTPGADKTDIAAPLLHLVRETVLEFEGRMPENIRVRSHVDSKHLVVADPSSFREMLTNILTNATNAIGDQGGQICLRVEDMEQPQLQPNSHQHQHQHQQTQAHPQIDPHQRGSRVKITVSDNGPGIAPEHLERVLDPYFTTKPAGARGKLGVGLGLSIAHRLLTDMGGELSMDSLPGKGCTVTLVLPVAEAPEGPEAPESSGFPDATELPESSGFPETPELPESSGAPPA